MTLAQLRTFCAVATLNSFSRAAEKLHLTQPAVSAQVVALEDALKVKLFDRVGKKISLSESGRVALAAAEEILGRVARLQTELIDLRELRAGRVAIGASQVVGSYLLPELLARFRGLHPGVEIDVRVEPARRVIEMLVEGALDVAIVGEGSPIRDERIAVKPVLRDELLLIVPSNHVFAQMRSVRPESLRQMPFALPRRDSASAESLMEQLSAAGIAPESVMELGNIGAVKRAVEAGLGISFVSRLAVSHELEDGRLRAVKVRGLKLERQIFLCWHHGKPFSKATEAFIGFVNRDLQGAARAVAGVR
ncbi:MAG: LysR family transcriptional regulator [Burkholderiales bacterium]|nr:LysR family transcriptional regulator [Burkholderiales bacterium]